MGDIETVVAKLDSYDTLSERAFDEIVRGYGFEPDNEELVSRLIDEGWSHCLVFRDDATGEYIHEKPPWNRLTAVLKTARLRCIGGS